MIQKEDDTVHWIVLLFTGSIITSAYLLDVRYGVLSLDTIMYCTSIDTAYRPTITRNRIIKLSGKK